MVVTCPGCGSWFIVCAVHLEPDAQTVRCLKCGTRWSASTEGTAAPAPQQTLRQLGADVTRASAAEPASGQSNVAQAGAAQVTQPARAPNQPVAGTGGGKRPFGLLLIALILIGVVAVLAQPKQPNGSRPLVVVPEIAAGTTPVDQIPAQPATPERPQGGHIF